jgi:hypothetical protein
MVEKKSKSKIESNKQNKKIYNSKIISNKKYKLFTPKYYLIKLTKIITKNILHKIITIKISKKIKYYLSKHKNYKITEKKSNLSAINLKHQHHPSYYSLNNNNSLLLKAILIMVL